MIVVLLAILGLCFGSFVNALVWRMYQQSKPRKKQPKVDLSIVHGRSVCSHCHHQLAVIDLVPVVSWMTLGGKCRYCRQPIGWQDPVVELLMASLFVLSYVVWPYGFEALGVFQFVTWLICLVGLIALLVYDFNWMVLPDRLVYAVTGIAASQVIVLAITQSNAQLLVGALWGVICLAGLFYGLFQISGGRWIGGGDVKLGVALGLLVGGPLSSLVLLFLAALLGSVCSIPLLLTGKRAMSQKLAFGPFLIIATIIVYLFGGILVGWYKRQFLLL